MTTMGKRPYRLLNRTNCRTLEDIRERCVENENGCWVWQKCVGTTGYGKTRLDGRDWKAHRLAYSLANPDANIAGLHVCHSCDTPLCVNPKHLFVGSAADNIRDACKKGRIAAGEKHYKTSLTSDDVEAIRSLVANGMLQRGVAAKFGISCASVGRIARGETWKK